MIFKNRRQAGKLLAEKLSEYSGREDVLVLAIPRGGVVVGAEISRLLNISLDVVVTKKIGAPGNPELAIGAVAEDGEPIIDQGQAARLDVSKEYIKQAVRRVKKEKVRSYVNKFRGGRELDVRGKTVVVTDDGVATGLTMEAALSWLIKKKPGKIILVVPTGASDSMERIERLADETICLDKPMWFSAVGQFYEEFVQVEDEEVKKILTAN